MKVIPRRKQKIKYSRKLACKHLEPKGDISNSLQPLCICSERELVLGTKAYVCQVCDLYVQTNKKISEVYDESKFEADKKIKEQKIKLEEYELEQLKGEEEIDLSIDEFEEQEEVITKYEKRKAGKDELESEELGTLECPFCGEVVNDLPEHVQTCEFAPDDVDLDDIIPKKSKKKQKRKRKSSASSSKEPTDKGAKKTKECPYCGKSFQRLGRHINSCPKRPADADEDEEEEEGE